MVKSQKPFISKVAPSETPSRGKCGILEAYGNSRVNRTPASVSGRVPLFPFGGTLAAAPAPESNSVELLEKSLPDLTIRPEKGANLKARLMRQKQERMNEDVRQYFMTLVVPKAYSAPRVVIFI
jgi:hypothetical protein